MTIRLFFCILLATFQVSCEPPALTVVFVISQCPYQTLIDQKPQFTDGLKILLDQGVVYANATMPHGLPQSGPGAATLVTGALPKDHGIIANEWLSTQQLRVMADEDGSTSAAVFAPNSGIYTTTISSKNLMIDTLSDQLALANTSVYSLSLKSTPAVIMAGKMGKAIWYDSMAKRFTSSKTYYPNGLPEWLLTFNDRREIKAKTEQSDNWMRTATFKDGDLLLCELARTCIRIDKAPRKMLWISLSGMDLIGHQKGPSALETTSHLKELDSIIGSFIKAMSKIYKAKDMLFVLTSDHGVAPIPESLNQKGLTFAHRLDSKAIREKLNSHIRRTFGIDNVILSCEDGNIYLDERILRKHPLSVKTHVMEDIKKSLSLLEGIKQVWTFDELRESTFEPYDVRNHLKNQLYQGRSGQLIYLVEPYTMVTNLKTGTTHQTPYRYDTHVPLIMYQKEVLTAKTIYDEVVILQVAPTLATFLSVQRPSVATWPLLPGLGF